MPLSLAYSPLVQAAEEKTEPKWYQSSGNDNNRVFEHNTASSLSQRENGGDASGMVRSAASGALNNSIEAWLNQFGTARVQLNLDNRLNTAGSEADLLVPLYDDKSTILFSQLGFCHKDDRNTGNIGLGVRHFTGDWMLGVNSFYDNDFTGDNRRLGFGVEAWRDFLKLSGNHYIRLSDWHQSRDFRDYDERPANGYDLRAESWLPAYPQLGAKLMYEQYYGDEVALFGKDNRQKDPWAFTGGITYTPIPLITVGAQHRAGKDGEQDSQINFQLNYRIGETWDKQIDPGSISALRSLAGTKYDLVERNNNIVLEYRKQDTIELTLAEKITGKSHSTIPLNFSVKTKHPLQRIDWDASSLIAAGGSIKQTGNNQLSVILPAYMSTANNVYSITGVAYDIYGNNSSATADVYVEAAVVNVERSTVTVAPSTLPADGKSTSIVSINLVDADNNPVPEMKESLAVSLQETLLRTGSNTKTSSALPKDFQETTVSAIEEKSPGIYQAIITAGTRAGTLNLHAMFNGQMLQEVTITQFAATRGEHFEAGTLVATSNNNPANNIAANVVEATVIDLNGNPVAD
ncbi:TPA: inverse autotransporter beta domain-containing protein, partial [Enterobacter kobei]|nr:inverse autotransporter beta domain-containing protein [Enterobacter kobei]